MTPEQSDVFQVRQEVGGKEYRADTIMVDTRVPDRIDVTFYELQDGRMLNVEA